MNTYEVHYWFKDASHFDVIEAVDEAAAIAVVAAEKPEADIWGTRARAFEYVTNGDKPCAEAIAKMLEGDDKWYIFVNPLPGSRSGGGAGDTHYVNDDGIGLNFYNEVRHNPWSEVASISITPRF